MLLGILLIFAAGCFSPRVSDGTPASVAKRYAVGKFGFIRPKVDRIVPIQDGYEVFIWDQPYRPGNNLVLILSKDLRLVDWMGGR